MQKVYIALVVLLLGVIVAGSAWRIFLDKPSIVYVNSTILFEKFNGKRDLKSKLESQNKLNVILLDSLQLIMESNPMDEVRIKEFYDTKAETERNEAESAARYTDQIWVQLNASITEYGEKNGYELILGATGDGNILFAHKTLDITNDLIGYVNKKYDGE